MDNKKILITRNFPEIGADLLKSEGFEITQWAEDRPLKAKELKAMAVNHQVLFCTISDRIDKEFLHANPQLQMISQFGVGYDNIDVAEATRLGIPIGYTPDVLTDATADIAFGLMIATSRKMFYQYTEIQKGNWNYFRPNSHLGIELKNKTIGIYGLGRIGFEMAKRCKGAYNMQVIYHNRKPNLKAEKELNARLVDFNTLLSQSDVLSVHCSLSDQTKGIFNQVAFSRMKSTAIFVNTARGLVHNEADLIEALQKGIIWGAGLDVTNPEPMLPVNPLLNLPNVSVLPHIGSATVETRSKMSEMAAQNIINYFKFKQVPHIVNPEVIK